MADESYQGAGFDPADDFEFAEAIGGTGVDDFAQTVGQAIAEQMQAQQAPSPEAAQQLELQALAADITSRRPELALRRRDDGKLVTRKDAGLPHIHGMRHSLATRIIEDGHRTEDATAILRHKDSEVTRRTYVHAVRSVEQHARLGDLLEKMSSGMARTDGDTPAPPPVAKAADVAYLSEIRETA